MYMLLFHYEVISHLKMYMDILLVISLSLTNN